MNEMLFTMKLHSRNNSMTKLVRNIAPYMLTLGGSLKRSLGMALSSTIPKAFGFEAATLQDMKIQFDKVTLEHT